MEHVTDLRRLSNKSVAGPGFHVMVPDIHEVHYAEADLIYKVEIEGGKTNERGQVEWLVYCDTLAVIHPPHHVDSFSAEEKDRILKNIGKSLLALDMHYELA